MKKIIFFLLILTITPNISAGIISERLLFMGEDTHIISIASGRPELPEKAPAVATVIDSNDIEKLGLRTLREVLSTVPGFYTPPSSEMPVLYMRGIKYGPLMLYDGVPLTTDSTKAVYPLEEELNLEYIKRIEIVRGPGSVLWGPDAFTGVINIVPKRGRDINGVSVKTILGTPFDERGVSVLFGNDWGNLDIMGFLSSYTKKGLLGKKTQEFMEGVFKLNYLNSLKLSFRFSNYRRPFVSNYYRKKDFKWLSRFDLPFNIIKLEYTKKFAHTSFKLKGTYSKWNITRKEGKFSWSYRNSIYYGELSINQDLFNEKGLLTAGLSIRRNFVKNALLSVKAYIPEYLLYLSSFEPFPSSSFKYVTIERDFDTTLISVFAQYVHRFKSAEIWVGGRYDDHSDYKSTFSYSLGANFYPSKHYTLKIIAGKAYRTPYATQFLKREIDPEKVTTFSAELSFKPFQNMSFDFVIFKNNIKDYINEDPFGGYSLPHSFSISGAEISWNWKTKYVRLWANYTFLGFKGGKERYKIFEKTVSTPNGEKNMYKYYKNNVDLGSKHMLSAGLTLNPDKTTFLSIKLTNWGKFYYKYLNSEKSFVTGRQLFLDVFFSKKLKNNLVLSVKCENLLGTRKKLPGRFGRYKENGTKLLFTLNYKF